MPEIGTGTTRLLRSLSWATASSVFSLAASAFVALLLPKILGMEDYGYFQLFLFYSTLAGALTFGWLDGMGLRLGGREYASLDLALIATQARLLVLSQIVIAAGVIGVVLTARTGDDALILAAAALAAVILNVRGMPVVLLQATYRARDFSQVVLLERAAYVALILLAVVAGSRDYQMMVVCSLVAFALSTAFSLWSIRDVFSARPASPTSGWQEVTANVRAGLPLLVSNLSGMLAIGVVRLAIERRWGIVAFGSVSLLLGLAGLAVAVVNVVGLVVFPLFRRMPPERLRTTYTPLAMLLTTALLLVFPLYVPLRITLEAWLPAYGEAWTYLIWVLAVAVYESKQVLLLTTVLKVMRKERQLLAINVATLALAVVFALLATQVLARLDVAVAYIVLLVFLRAVASELYVGRLLRSSPAPRLTAETLAIIGFIVLGTVFHAWWVAVGILLVYGAYMIVLRRALTQSVRDMFVLMAR